MSIPSRYSVIALLALGSVTAPGCDRSANETYVPGLGEIMTATQMRHSKLWLAGQAGNWQLAAYELHELQEGFSDAVLYHPKHENAPISDLIPQMTSTPGYTIRTQP